MTDSEKVEVVVVGGGQAGVAMSEHLSGAGIQHVVLERARIAEKWRTGRWDSLVANGPAWHDRFPGLEFGTDPDEFPHKEAVADYFETYAKRIGAPIRCGVEVTSVTKREGAPGFLVRTSQGSLVAQYVVAATGPFQKPSAAYWLRSKRFSTCCRRKTSGKCKPSCRPISGK